MSNNTQTVSLVLLVFLAMHVLFVPVMPLFNPVLSLLIQVVYMTLSIGLSFASFCLVSWSVSAHPFN